LKYHKKVGWAVMGFAYAVAAIALFHFSRKEHKVRQDCEKLSKTLVEHKEVKATHNELEIQLSKALSRFTAEQNQLARITGSSISYKTSSALLENFPGANWPLATFSPLSGDRGKKGFLSFPDDSTQLVAYVRYYETNPDSYASAFRGRQSDKTNQIIDVLSNFDNRIAIKLEPQILHCFEFPVSQQDAAFQLSLRLTNTNKSTEIKLSELSAEFKYSGHNPPYRKGFFKPSEHPVLCGWPDFDNAEFLRLLQARGIWLIPGHYMFRVKGKSHRDSPCLTVLLTFETEGSWRVHPAHFYARSLRDLQWDTEAQNYIVGPDSIHNKE